MTHPLNTKALLALLLACACRAEPTRPETGSETHFLSFCAAGGACENDLNCVCGVCTEPCSSGADCSALSVAVECVAVDTEASGAVCDDAVMACDVACSDDADCAPLSTGHRCDRGQCRQLAEDCATTDVAGSDVLLLGDQFIADTHEITSELIALARETGALGSDDVYRDDSDALITPFGGPNDLALQYATAVADRAPRFVIMDVGGPNALLTCPEPLSADCPALVDAVSGAQALWQQMDADGVEAVVNFFYPDPADAALKAKFDVLRIPLREACEEGPLPCYFIDLRVPFAGHEAYLESGGILPTAEGSAVTAALIFSVMQQHCVAQ